MSGQKTRTGIWMPLLLAACLVLGMIGGNLLKTNSSRQTPIKIFARDDKLNTILDFIEQNYVDSVNRDAVGEEMIPTLLEQLDPHSIYIPVRELPSVNETMRGNFDGIGVQFNMQNDTILVIQTVAGGPSDKSGILAGDRIIRVDEVAVAGVGMAEDSIVGRLRGPRGSVVKVGIYRPVTAEILDFKITRGVIPVRSVDVAYMINEKTGFIKINTFSQSTYTEFHENLGRLRNTGCRKLILDLRGNTGGIMEPAIKIADDFLEKGSLIVYTEGRARKRHDYLSTGQDAAAGMEIAILIDEGSASASEIVAGAIQDNDRGWIVGRRSFGKGLVQEQALLNDGSAIRLTTARYYTPTGRSIQKPYDNGIDDYYHDILRRYRSGEFAQADSIRFSDSLRFVTPKGRVVYGGGGIMPDYFVPYDSSGITPLFLKINQGNLIYRFALTFADQHRDELSVYKEARDLADYLDSQDVLGQFRKHVESRGMPLPAPEWKESALIIRTQLKAYIARNILDNEGFYPIIQEIDNALMKAVEVLK